MTGNKRTQDVGDNIFMLSHNELYYSFFTREQITQSAAVNIQQAAAKSGLHRGHLFASEHW